MCAHVTQQSITTLSSTWQLIISISCHFDHLQPEGISDPLPKVSLRSEQSSHFSAPSYIFALMMMDLTLTLGFLSLFCAKYKFLF